MHAQLYREGAQLLIGAPVSARALHDERVESEAMNSLCSYRSRSALPRKRSVIG